MSGAVDWMKLFFPSRDKFDDTVSAFPGTVCPNATCPEGSEDTSGLRMESPPSPSDSTGKACGDENEKDPPTGRSGGGDGTNDTGRRAGAGGGDCKTGGVGTKGLGCGRSLPMPADFGTTEGLSGLANPSPGVDPIGRRTGQDASETVFGNVAGESIAEAGGRGGR